MLVLGFQKNQPVKKKVGKLFQVGVPPVGHGKPQSQALDLCQVPAAGLPVGRLVPKADGQDRAPDVRTVFSYYKRGLGNSNLGNSYFQYQCFMFMLVNVTVIHFVL